MPITAFATVRTKPKRPVSAYSMFFRDQRKRISELKKADPSLRGKPLATLVAHYWKQINPETRLHYDQLAAEDKFRHYAEKMEYSHHLECLKQDVQSQGCRYYYANVVSESEHSDEPLPLEETMDGNLVSQSDAEYLLRALSYDSAVSLNY